MPCSVCIANDDEDKLQRINFLRNNRHIYLHFQRDMLLADVVLEILLDLQLYVEQYQ